MKKCVCGHINDDSMRFCENCGTELKIIKNAKHPESKRIVTAAERDDAINVVEFICGFIGKLISFIVMLAGGKKERIDVKGYKLGEKNLVPDKIEMCEGEKLVKQYYCAREHLTIFGVDMSHFIQVTNKRVIFSKMGNSFFGTKSIQTEIPISDVANVSIEKGYKFNLLTFLFGGYQLLPYLMVILPAALLGFILNLVEKTGTLTLLCSIGLFVASFFVKDIIINKKKFIISDALYYSSFGIILFSGIGNLYGASDFQKLVNAIALILKIVLFIRVFIEFLGCIVKKYYYVTIGARTGEASPISTGGREMFAFNGDILESFIPVVPAVDAEIMERELSAMILDIQQRGDYGIEKWCDK